MLSLETLNLSDTFITPSGWITFFTLLQRPGSVLGRLVKLSIMDRNISDEVLVCIANALAANSSLKVLNFEEEGLTEIGWTAIECTLCNKSSIDTIYDSNHTLTYGEGLYPNSFYRLLKLNWGTDKAEVARQKIVQYHFLEGNGSNMHDIMKMDLEMMPHVIGFFARYDMITECGNESLVPPVEKVAGLELIYLLTRGMPSLFD